ncbi:MAG: HlyD family efflux transporter periplasmic adaptor subunit [Gammaproteobacteria bacterium]|nr:HlyD family efflux transporter periplasmic adaptor subunit [Gammaproteobacteria bacterium]
MRTLGLIFLLPVLLATACSRDTSPVAEGAAPTYVAVARGRVEVEGGLLKVGAPREGTLSSIAVREGDRVTQGQVLGTLGTEAARLHVAVAEATLAQARAQRELLDTKLRAARTYAQRLAEAAEAGAGDGQSADAAATAVQALATERIAADAGVALAMRKREEARHELALRTLRAPMAAEVVRVTGQPGARVSPGSDPVFTLLPLTTPIVRAELTEPFVDAVSTGMPARVSTDGGGTERSWQARVLHVGRVFGMSTLEDDPQQHAVLRTVSCILTFDRPPDEVRVGQRVLVRFGEAIAGEPPGIVRKSGETKPR